MRWEGWFAMARFAYALAVLVWVSGTCSGQGQPEGKLLTLPVWHLVGDAAEPPPMWAIVCSDFARGSLSARPLPPEAIAAGLPPSAMALGYVFEPGGAVGHMVEATRFIPLPTGMKGISVTVRASDSPHRMALRVVDEEHESFQWDLGHAGADPRFDKVPGWVTRYRDITEKTAEAHWGGDGDGVFDYPLRLQSLGVIREGPEQLEGEYLFASVDVVFGEEDEVRQRLVRLAAYTRDDAPRGCAVRYEWEPRQPDANRGTGTAIGRYPGSPAPGPGCFLLEYEGDCSHADLSLWFEDAAGRRWAAPTAHRLVEASGIGVTWANTASLDASVGEGERAPEAVTYPLEMTGLLLADFGQEAAWPHVHVKDKGELFLRELWFLPEEAE